MKRMFIAANWKSNITKNEAKSWIEKFKEENIPQDIEIVIFPSFTILDFLSNYINENSLNIKIGAQNISAFKNGAYTGEISGELIKDFASYVLIGHSERRRLFYEDRETISEKINQARENNLKIILCVSNLEELAFVSDDVNLTVAFEPISAIGTNSPADVEMVKHFVKETEGKFSSLIYGGSVTSLNVNKYTKLDNISGVLVGSESLNPVAFANIIKNVL